MKHLTKDFADLCLQDENMNAEDYWLFDLVGPVRTWRVVCLSYYETPQVFFMSLLEARTSIVDALTAGLAVEKASALWRNVEDYWLEMGSSTNEP